MHIEPGILTGAKMAVSYVTGTAALAATLYAAARTQAKDSPAYWPSFAIKTAIAFLITFAAFEWLPHPQAGISEIHLILGTTLFLLFGLTPAGLGLAAALLVQGLWFAPHDLPQYLANVTTLLVPLLGVAAVAQRTIPAATPYVALRYRDLFRLSLTFHGGVVAWVAFWAFLGLGGDAAEGVAHFLLAYSVILFGEPLLDLALLALAKRFAHWSGAPLLFTDRLYRVG